MKNRGNHFKIQFDSETCHQIQPNFEIDLIKTEGETFNVNECSCIEFKLYQFFMSFFWHLRINQLEK